MKHTLAALVAIIITAAPAFAQRNGTKAGKACTYEICVASAISHGHSQPVASRWCTAHLAIGDACKNVGGK